MVTLKQDKLTIIRVFISTSVTWENLKPIFILDQIPQFLGKKWSWTQACQDRSWKKLCQLGSPEPVTKAARHQQLSASFCGRLMSHQRGKCVQPTSQTLDCLGSIFSFTVAWMVLITPIMGLSSVTVLQEETLPKKKHDSNLCGHASKTSAFSLSVVPLQWGSSKGFVSCQYYYSE